MVRKTSLRPQSPYRFHISRLKYSDWRKLNSLVQWPNIDTDTTTSTNVVHSCGSSWKIEAVSTLNNSLVVWLRVNSSILWIFSFVKFSYNVSWIHLCYSKCVLHLLGMCSVSSAGLHKGSEQKLTSGFGTAVNEVLSGTVSRTALVISVSCNIIVLQSTSGLKVFGG